jgi:hypothetical protein
MCGGLQEKLRRLRRRVQCAVRNLQSNMYDGRLQSCLRDNLCILQAKLFHWSNDMRRFQVQCAVRQMRSRAARHLSKTWLHRDL